MQLCKSEMIGLLLLLVVGRTA